MAQGFQATPNIKEEEITNEIPKVDYEKYCEFVDEVTSDETKYTDSFLERIGSLEDQGADIQRLLTSAIGLSAEAGEFAEIVKKITFQGKPYNQDNIDHMKIELGDCMWYIAQAMMALGASFDEITLGNTHKLLKRYPGGEFSIERSENRAAGDR
ncbi:MazG-like pyrophosphatase [Synechococcus phage S-SSM4]|jgi:NTP pyrophosphatase (non-canonical NTP hydrolase)|uniref:MazG n=1 Tax=Synechococcus phage S-SSM4 TaxID=536466 RepID=M1T2C0_9CAUD|nr:MazG-like pyrophosphatase [Synechococcus phage S-SSM4]AGG54195.1 MazG [Synechococcus phage S-SSM4]AGG54446.1 MazG protein [Cyanophage S-SSM6b]|tara:strand:- start:2124 stop:2588 length:465 start_codon:yes stop_codon:yes gene_type:complete